MAMASIWWSLRCLLLLPLLGRSESISSLGIGTASKLAELFRQHDADGNGALQDNELTDFETSSQSALSNYWFMAPFEASLYAEADCSGASQIATASSEEARCKKCYDVCGKTFSDGTSMSEKNSSRASGYATKVRSLRVTKGAVHVSSAFCFGTYNFGFNATSGGRVVDTQEGCVNFQEAAHLMAVDARVLEVVSLHFLKEDQGPTFDHRLSVAEAPDLLSVGIFRGADSNEDQFLSPAEYASAMLADMANKAASRAFMSADAMEAAAGAAQGPDGDSASQAQLARAAFGENYQAALEDPAIGTQTLAPISTGPNGQVIVTGGGSSSPVEFGDVKDEGMVEGSYDPQNTGNVMMCTEGKLYHRGLCYEPCKYAFPDAQFQVCFAKNCPAGKEEVAGGLCKEPGLLGALKTAPKASETRGQGVPPDTCRLGDSFGPGAQDDNGNRDFTVLIAADPQLPWCSGEIKSDWDCAIEENFRVVQSMHNVESLVWETGEKVAKPIGVHIAGDLTAYAHENQIQEYRKIWETREVEDPDKNIKLPVWPGLGNHDYSNNLNACFFLDEELTWAGYGGVASCAQRAIAYVRSAVAKCSGKTVVPNFGGFVDHYSHDSAAYAVKYGRIRFVHLHNYPTFRRQELTGVASTLGFLREEVEIANRTGDYLVLVIHDIGNKFSHRYNEDRMKYFFEITEGARILAMFSGHWHPMGGQVPGYANFNDVRHPIFQEDDNGNVKQTGYKKMVNAWGEEVQIVRGYAPDKQKFLVTQWNVARCFWRFGSVNSNATANAKKPVWVNSQDLRDMRNFTIPNCTVDENYVPPTDFNIGSLSRAPLSRPTVMSVVSLILAGLVSL